MAVGNEFDWATPYVNESVSVNRDYEHAVVFTDAAEAQVRFLEDIRTPKGRERLKKRAYPSRGKAQMHGLFWMFFHILLAMSAVWLATAQPDANRELDFQVGIVVYIISVSLAAYWLIATLDV